jgi:hypothetical protein
MNSYQKFIYFIIIIKFLFILLSISDLFFIFNYGKDSNLHKISEFWKKRVEYIFTILMAILLIFLFNPKNNKHLLIDNDTKLLLYLFGIVLLFTSNWELFIKESKWFKYLQKKTGIE